MAANVLARWAADTTGLEAADISDAKFICRLVETLTGKKAALPNNQQDDKLSLSKAAFALIDDAGLPVASLTCSPQEVADGDQVAITSLMWSLAESFSIAPQFPGADGHWKGAMMAWCQSVCSQHGVSISDFHRSWQNGLAFSALVASAHDESSMAAIDVKALKPENAQANLTLCFSIAERSLGVPTLLDATEIAGPTIPDERAVLLYLSVLHKRIRESRSGNRPVTSIPWSIVDVSKGDSQSNNGPQGTAVDEVTTARQALRKAMLGRPLGPGGPIENSGGTSDEVLRVAALIEELREPINNVAEVLDRADGPQSVAEAKATFKQLTDRMRRLVEVLPDTLECTQEAQALEESIQAEMRRVRARAEFEEAYIARLLERQKQCKAMSSLLQTNVSDQYEQLRRPVLELLKTLDAKERHLKDEILEVENDKLSILTQSQRIAESDLQRMRVAETKADALLRTKIVSASWLETGHSVENLLVSCEAGRIEGKSDFPESFTDFNCTLDLRLEHNIVGACQHALLATEFEERKVLESAELAMSHEAAVKHASTPAALMIGTSKTALTVAGSSESLRSIVQQANNLSPQEATNRKAAWSLTVDGDWIRLDDSRASNSNSQRQEIEKILAHARKLPPKEADEFLSQDFVRSILKGAEGQRQSAKILQAALHEAASGRAPPMGGLSGDYSKMGEQVAAQLSTEGLHSKAINAAPPAGLIKCDGKTILVIGGWDGSSNLHTLECLGVGDAAWSLFGSLSSSRRGLTAASLNGKVYVMGGWDGSAYLSSVEVYDIASGSWSSVRSMSQPRCFAAAAVMDGKIYVAGGYYGSFNLDTAEVYDVESDTWTALPNMSCPRRGLALSAIDGHLYAVGGWDGKHNLASVEAYSKEVRAWRRVEPLSTPRCSAACAVLNGKLYCCGGWDGNTFLQSVEMYDPRYGTTRNPVGEWTPVTAMLTPRSYGAVVAVGGRLIALGGWDGVSARRLDSAESYTPQGGRWVPLPAMTCPRYGLAAVAV